jgi:hypothetical protein
MGLAAHLKLPVFQTQNLNGTWQHKWVHGRTIALLGQLTGDLFVRDPLSTALKH